MRRISARTLLTLTTAELWDILYCDFIIVFDDQIEVVSTWKEAVYSSYFWEFHRLYPKTPLLSRHHVSSVLEKGYMTSKTHIRLLSIVYFDLIEAYHLYNPAERDSITRMVYQITNRLYNDLTIKGEAHVISIDILDFLNITQHPYVKETLDREETTQEYIEECYTRLRHILDTDTSLNTNPIVMSNRAGIVTTHQLLQCVGPRGRVTEVDSFILPQAVSRGFVKGMRSVYNMVAESRTAARALTLADSDLKEAEYFARRLQLLVMAVERLHYEDCGSTEYVTWRVKPPVVENGITVYPGDLHFLEGKYYCNENEDGLLILKRSDAHLNNKYIKFRSPLMCQHPDKAGVCAVCFGQLADNVMPNVNLGHPCSGTVTQKTTQSTLSAKHIQASSQGEQIQLGPDGRRFFTIDTKKMCFYLRKDIKQSYLKLVISQKDAFGLMDIDVFRLIGDLNPTRISKIDYVSIITNPDDPLIPICMSQKGRCPVLSVEFLHYAKIRRWEIDENNNFVFNLDNWDRSKPIAQLTEMEYSFAKNSREIASVIESRMAEMTDRLKQESPVRTLTELFDLVNAKLTVNIALLEIIVYASMIKDGGMDDFGFARGSSFASMGVFEKTIRGRSLSANYGYELQHKVMLDPKSFYKNNRPDSVFDVLFDPINVLRHVKK